MSEPQAPYILNPNRRQWALDDLEDDDLLNYGDAGALLEAARTLRITAAQLTAEADKLEIIAKEKKS